MVPPPLKMKNGKNLNVENYSIIEFIPLDNYQAPEGVDLKSEALSFWKKFFPSSNNKKQGIDKGNLQGLNDQYICNLVPELDDECYYKAFDTLTENKSTENGLPLFVITPPFSNLNEKLTARAREKGNQIITAPEDLFSSPSSNLQYLPEKRWIIPALDRWFVRHASGMDHIRNLFEQITQVDASGGIILCNSWAWSYLEKILSLYSLSNWLYTLKPTNSESLAKEILDYTGNIIIEFKQTDNGKVVLKRGQADEKKSQSDPDPPLIVGDFLKQLASYTHGNRTIAMKIWQQALRAKQNNGDKNSPGHNQNVFWVVPWEDLELPVVPADYNWKYDILLHTLLIHGRLASKILPELLPYSSDELAMVCTKLIQEDLVISEEEHYRISKVGYPAIRQHLSQRGYTVGLS